MFLPKKVKTAEEKEGKFSFFLLFVFVLILATALNFYHLTTFITSDEEGWLAIKIPTFFQALTTFNWEKLLVSDKPGVTVVWLVKAGAIFSKQPLEKFVNEPQLLFWARLPLIFANIGLLLWLTLLVKEATQSQTVAALFLAVTATNPTIRGMAAIVNPDSISWFFPLGFLLAFYLCLKNQQAKYLWQAAIIFSVGILTKFTFLIVLPFLLLLLPVYYLLNNTKQNFFKLAVITFFKIYGLSFFLSIFLWPYLIVVPQQYLYTTFLKPLYRPILLPAVFLLGVYFLFANLIENKLEKLKTFLPNVIAVIMSLLLLGLFALTFKLTPDLPSVPKGTKINASFSRLLVNNFYYHLYSQTTLTIILYLLALVFICVFVWQKKENRATIFFVVICLLFIAAYLIGSALVKHQTSPRYQISIYPFVSLLTAAMATFFPKISWQQKIGFTVLLVAVNALLLKPFAPYYLLYYNNLLPPGKLVFDGWGLGGYEAAKYLNKKSNAKNLTVYASYEGFEQFFVGRTVLFTENPFKKGAKMDYLVIFKQGEKRIIIGNKKQNIFWRYKAPAEFQFVINKVPVVKVIKFKN